MAQHNNHTAVLLITQYAQMTQHTTVLPGCEISSMVFAVRPRLLLEEIQ